MTNMVGKRFQQLQMTNIQEIQQIQQPTYHSKCKPLAPSCEQEPEDQEYEEGEEFQDGEKNKLYQLHHTKSCCAYLRMLTSILFFTYFFLYIFFPLKNHLKNKTTKEIIIKKKNLGVAGPKWVVAETCIRGE
jgi:hypothetical protein